MTELQKPELSEQDRFIRKWIIPRLNADVGDFEDATDENIEVAKSILAQEYNKHASSNLRILTKAMVLTLVYDFFHALPPEIYGLLLSLISSISLAIPALHTPESLAGTAIATERSLEKKIRHRAEESVKTNVGVVGIAAGFGVQILSVIDLVDSEVLRNNLLAGVVPSVVTTLLVATAGVYALDRIWPGDG
jgi:hypothetical protein